MARKRSKAFWNNFKFKYKLTIINENTLEEIVGLRVSKLNGLSVLLSVLAVLFLIAACIIAFTPLRNYLPGYMNSEVRSQIVDNALRCGFPAGTARPGRIFIIMNIQDIFARKSADRQRADTGLADCRSRRHLDGAYQTGRRVSPSIRRK